jgi:transposase
MPQATLFELPEVQTAKPVVATRPEEARVVRPVRNQGQWEERNLDVILPEDDQARGIWAFLQQWDLSGFYASIKAVAGTAGRPASDPMVLLAVWLLALVDRIGSARQVDRLCKQHDSYRWMCGGVPVDYHILADFRVEHREVLNDLFTEILAAMMAGGLVTLRHVAQDGMRVRASAGASSYHRKDSLEKCLTEARERVEQLAAEREHPDPGATSRERAARERAARERQERVAEALRCLPQIQAAKDNQRRKLAKSKRGRVTEARVSTTDPEVQVVKMPDGGFRPAYNAELATDVDSQVIVGVGVTTMGTDSGQALPMAEQITERTGLMPEAYLMDGDFARREDITALERKGITVYTPTRPPRTTTSGRTQGMARPDDTPEVAAWRGRMETEEAKAIYRERAATAECVNAQGRLHGLRQFTVRGTAKVLSVLLLTAIVHNMLRWIALTQ